MFVMFSASKFSPKICLLFSSRAFARQAKKIPDPGISRRAKALSLKEDELEIENFDDFESEFMSVHKSHVEHHEELKALKEREKLLIVRQKYFKEKFPNFLTWHDKQQIRYLHDTDPDDWTVDRLAEGFPALPETIKKIIKSKWTKNTQNKITNHDASVQKNWKMFKEGKFPDLPKDLVQHLNKFTNRALNLKPFEFPTKNIIEVKKEISTEFSDIITSYQKIKSKNEEKPMEKKLLIEGQKSLDSSSQRPITLSTLQSDLIKKAESGKSVNEEEERIMNITKKESPKLKEHIDLVEHKYEAGVQLYKKTQRDLSHLHYPERITIPTKILKKGCLYKLNDCYYDDDGEFLYRVPGMG